MLKTVLMPIFLCAVGCASTAPVAPERPGTVFLLHGALRSSTSMDPVERALTLAGYPVVNTPVPRMSRTLEENASDLADLVAAHAGEGPFHFVTHSYGGLVARHYLARVGCPDPGRLVMLAPPNHGSALAARFSHTPMFKIIYRRAADVLVPDPSDRVGVPTAVEFGVVAGARGDDQGWNPLLPGDDDGVLAVDETRLDGAADFITVPHPHSLIMSGADTHRHVVSFIKTGHFAR